MKLEGTTALQAAKNLQFLKRHAPYRFSGRYYVAVIDGQAYGYLNQKALMTKAAKAGMTSLEFVTVE